MKKLSYVVMAMLFAVSAGFVSCSDEDDPFADNDPIVQVKLDGTNITSPYTVENKEGGTPLTFTIQWKMGAAGDKLINAKIISTLSGKTFTELDSVLNKGIFNSGQEVVNYTYATSVGANEEKLTFQTTDKEGRVGKFEVTIKPNAIEAESGFITSEATLLGGQNSAKYGSFYSVALAKVLSISGATSQSASVDFAYFYGASNEATICAPSDPDGQTISYGSVKTSSWSTKNATKFYKVPGEVEIDGDLEDLADNWDTVTALLALGTTKANKLAAGDAVVFQTAGGVQGIFLVTKVDGTQTGSITITIIEKVK
jgi:hypothetical protein